MSKARFQETTPPDTPAAGKVVVYVDEADKHLKQKDDTGAVKDLTNTDGLTDKQFADKVGSQTDLHGVIPLDDIVELNTDISKIDIIPFDYFIQGIFYQYAGGTTILPTIATGDSSTWVGINTTEIVYSENEFTDEETKTILPLARLQTLQGQSGAGSDLQEPLPKAFAIGLEGYSERLWIKEGIGVLYAKGGTYIENTGVPLQVDQEAGKFFTAQRRPTSFGTTANIEASRVYHVNGIPSVQNRATLIVPLFYDDDDTGNIVELPLNKYVSHTLLRSPKEENLFFFIYGSTLYDSQAQAEEAPVSYSIFQSQSFSGIYTVANFVVGGASTKIEAIQDKRPNIILQDESTGKGILPSSYAGIYFSATEPTTISAIGEYVKIAGTSTEIKSSADFTIENNRLTHTGETPRTYKVDATTSITSVSNNQLIGTAYAINDEVILGSELQILGVATKVGAMPLTFIVELSKDEYIEQWVVNYTSTSNVTAVSKNMNIVSVD